MSIKNSLPFSIIVPAYNRANFLPATINSVLEQTFYDFEVIIVNDGSTDDTDEVIAPYLKEPRIQYFRIENSERGAARNYGVNKSKGSYVTFLDSDDIILPMHLSTAFQKIQQMDSPAVFHLGYEILHPGGRVDSLRQLPSPVNEKLLEGNFLSCMGVFLRRDIAISNPFNENRTLSGSEDYELWLRIAARYPIVVCPEVTSRLINHEGRSVINTDAKKLMSRMTLLDKTLHNDDLFMARFGSRLRIFASFRSLYQSLHLAMSGERWMAFKSLMYTLRMYPYVVFKYRFIVALKKIVLW
jgi:glycosyltransferase involved in cell wall biosynthesis